MRMNMELGRGFAAHSVASGKAFLLAFSNDWRTLLGRKEPYDRLTEHTKTTAKQLEAEFTAIRDAGVSRWNRKKTRSA